MAVFCLHRYYELTKVDYRDFVTCHPLLLYSQESLGFCSPAQKISRLFSFGSAEERIAAIDALIASPHNVAFDHLQSLIETIVFSNEPSEISASIEALSHVSNGRPDITQAIVLHDLFANLIIRLLSLSDSSWWTVLHQLYVRFVPSFRYVDTAQQQHILEILVRIVKDSNRRDSLGQRGSLFLLSMLSSDHSVSAILQNDADLLEFLSSMSTHKRVRRESSGRTDNDALFASEILANIDHLHDIAAKPTFDGEPATSSDPHRMQTHE